MDSPVLGRRAWLAGVGLAACSRAAEESRPGAGSTQPPRALGSAESGRNRAVDPPPAAAPRSGRAALAERSARLGELPAIALGDLPTPVRRASALSAELGLELWIKHDDASSNLFAGSKVRKLERLLADARALGHVELLTFGGVGSNHAVATAAFGRKAGFRVTVQLAGQPGGPHVARNLAACAAFGARIESIDGVADAHARAVRRERGKAPASSPYVIAPGGSSSLGHLGFVDAAFELADQVTRGELPAPDLVVMAMGTMGSTLGMAFGLRAAGLGARILAVRCSSNSASGPSVFERARNDFEHWLRLHDPRLEIASAEVILEGAFLGGGYAQPTAEGDAATSQARKDGLELEPTYTAKAFAALRARSASLAGKRVLLWASQPRRVTIDPAAVDERVIPVPLRRYLRP